LTELALRMQEAEAGIDGAKSAITDANARIAELEAERAKIRASIQKVAALVNSQPSDDSTAAGRKKAPKTGRGARSTKADHLDPRQLELLRLLYAKPAQPAVHYAKVMYNDEEKGPTVAAYFSRLKAAGYIELVERGRFKVTAKGAAAIGK
jgi:hypothetical protein